MFRLPTTVAVFLGCTLAAAAWPAAGQEKKPDDKKAWQEGELKKLEGRWTTVREEKTDQDKIRRRRVDLEFAGGSLKVFIVDEKDAQPWSGPPLKVIGVERDEALGSASRLKLERAQVYYDFVGENLIIVGGIGHRPFEGLMLSGEYRRVDPKQDSIKKDKEQLQGIWVAESGEAGGKPLPEQVLKTWKIVIKGDELSMQGVKFIGYRLDPSKTPKALDILTIDTPSEGIYKIDKDKLHCALGRPKERPKQFASDAESKQVYLILKREKP